MRISDWSSDVCSSDLTCGGKCTSTRSAPRGRGGRLACRSPRRGPWSTTWAATSAVTIAGGVRALAPHIVWEVHVWRELHEYGERARCQEPACWQGSGRALSPVLGGPGGWRNRGEGNTK